MAEFSKMVENAETIRRIGDDSCWGYDDEMRAIIETLSDLQPLLDQHGGPKGVRQLCEAGAKLPRTKDGVLVDCSSFEGSVVYRPDGVAGGVCFDPEVGWIVWPCPLSTTKEGFPLSLAKCYSTEEAALQSLNTEEGE